MLPLATTTWDDNEYRALQQVIDNGMFSMGERVATFEKEFSAYVGTEFCVMVNSGSSANLLAVSSLLYRKDGALQPGDEVIVPAVSWSTTYFPLQQCGLKLRFVDIDSDTLNIDLDQLAEAITDKTRAIFSVNLLGNPVDYVRLNEIIEGKNILLLEDNCESMGASLNGKKAGSYGIVGTFSSFFSHHISTMEGGMVCTDDEELYHIMLSLRSHGWTRHLPEKNLVCEKSNNDFQESFRFVLPGYNLRPLEMSGALGIEQLKKLPSIVEGRRKNAVFFQKAFDNIPGLTIQKETGSSSWFGFSLLFENSDKRNSVGTILKANGVECRPIVAGNFVKNEAVKYLDYSVFGDLKNSDLVDQNGLFIGNHHYDISRNLEKIRELFN